MGRTSTPAPTLTAATTASRPTSSSSPWDAPSAGRRSSRTPGRAAGRGAYHLDDPALDSLHRVSSIFEFLHAPVGWTDGRTLSCQHRRGNATCGSNALILSNEHLEEERRRLASQNGLLDGPTCGACGTHYLDAPDEFVFNGAPREVEGQRAAASRPTLGHPPDPPTLPRPERRPHHRLVRPPTPEGPERQTSSSCASS